METLLFALRLIGAYCFVIWTYETFRSAFGILRGLWKQRVNGSVQNDLVKRYGQWAVVTGGSNGIGRQYSLYLASKGFKLVILALQDEKLVAVKQELESKFSVEVRTIPVDFSIGFDIRNFVEQHLSGLNIGILVNNVGIGTRFGAYFDTFAPEQLRSLINVNIAAAVIMSYIVLPGMQRRGRGLLINISSVAGLAPVPTVTAYGASKAFMYNFSKALRVELAPAGVEVQTVTPNLVVTGMTEKLPLGNFENTLGISVESFGKFLTMTVGLTGLTTGHWKHAIAVTIQKLFPDILVSKVGHKLGRSVWRESKS